MNGSSQNARQRTDDADDPLDGMVTLAPEPADPKPGAAAPAPPPPMPAAPVAAGMDLSAELHDDAQTKAHWCAHIGNAKPYALTDIVAHGGPMVRHLPELPSAAGAACWVLHVPREEKQRLVVSYSDREGRGAACWQLEGAAGPTVVVGPAGDVHGDVVVNGADVQIVVGAAADVHGRIVVNQHRPEGRRLPLPLVATTRANAPGWLIQQRWRRILLFAGTEFTLGRCPKRSLWPVHRRAPDGVVALRAGQRITVGESQTNSPEIRFPISRVHATMRWAGGETVRVQDGSPDRRSKRGVYVDGVILDDGPTPFRTPVNLSLGEPEGGLGVTVAVDGVTLPDGTRALCLRQTGNWCDELVVWQPRRLPFGFAVGHLGHWYPTWFDFERQVAFESTPLGWRATVGGGMTTETVVPSSRIDIGQTAYTVQNATRDLLILASA